MPYIEKRYVMPYIVEVEKVHSSRYRSSGGRGKRKKPTPEQMARVNERNAIKKLRRMIALNFENGDLHLILTYRKELRLDPMESRKELSRFFRKLKSKYKKYDKELKYIVTTEYMNKAIHHHIILNNIQDFNLAKEINQLWSRGRPKLTILDDDGDYSKLAAYFVKETSETFKDNDSPYKKRYSCSRNLIKPKPKVRIIQAKTFAKEPKAPRGWYIDKDTLIMGVSEITGYPYQYYTLRKVRKKE